MNRVDQSGAQAEGDIVGRDKQENNYYNSRPQSKVEKLLQSLKQQIENNEHAKETIDELARYHRRKSIDEINGLEAKLNAAGRSDSYEDAIEKKEMFVKLLEKYALYLSAQQIFAHCLAKVDVKFNYIIYPEIPCKSLSEINKQVIEQIVDPIVEECGCDVFNITYDHVMGMVYWLAEQCFIRWHGHPQLETDRSDS